MGCGCKGFGGYEEYVVRPGDTLTGIALAKGLCSKGPGNTWDDWAQCIEVANQIAELNGIPDPDVISVGQVLRLPAAGSGLKPPVVARAGLFGSPFFALLLIGSGYLAWKTYRG